MVNEKFSLIKQTKKTRFQDKFLYWRDFVQNDNTEYFISCVFSFTGASQNGISHGQGQD